ncbi:energy-coupling factor transporter transmembrane component T family protein [uncultured Flavonifractor sp.]|uniref:energy-coupling factor transporter transmembrane component T family protein n=1 Tax=uncultured Flavonifractor sp. TaxID=1193534 RepID=UPI00260AE680|nr:energy-coupling factor transporter transmembrane component T [uncultured Flavonifractor sp.]
MALKDITLGQYFPGATPIHRLDPRVKIIGTIAYIVALFLAKWLVSYALLLVVLAIEIALSRIGLKSILRGMKPILIIVLITGLLNLLYTPGQGAPLVTFWVFTIYREGVWAACSMVLRIAMLITCTFLLTYTTSPIQLTDALERLMNPLKAVKVPVHELSMMMSIALRFIPTLIEETDKIMSAQKARGADFDSGNLVQKAKALVPLLVPLFISAFRRADELAIAMECRCYHGGEGRTRMRQLKLTAMDGAALTLSAALCVAAGVLARLGL